MFGVFTELFHWIGPIAPYRAPALNTVREVEKCVNGECADRKSLRVSLIVDSFVYQHIVAFELVNETHWLN